MVREYGDVLPWSNNEDNTEWDTLDVPPEAGLVCIGEGDVGQRRLGDGEHVFGALEHAADLTGGLRHRTTSKN